MGQMLKVMGRVETERRVTRSAAMVTSVEIHGDVIVLLAPSRIVDVHRLQGNNKRVSLYS